MAFRYLAIASKNPQRVKDFAVRVETNSSLRPVFAASHCSVFASDKAMCLSVGGGVVVGHVFKPGTGAPAISRFDERDGDRIHRTNGDVLIEDFWGGYVGIFGGGTADSLTILRDPSGALPCYVYRNGDAAIISSDLETLGASGGAPITVDWNYLAQHLRRLDLRTPSTAIVGLTEVMPGFRIDVFRPERPPEGRWSPWTFAQKPNFGTADEIAEDLGAVVKTNVHAWASGFEHILLSISGGLDSSILAAALKSSGGKTTLLTMCTDEFNGDERRYARAVGEGLDLPMIEAFHDLDRVDVTKATAPHLPRPLFSAFGQSEHKIKFALSADLGVDAVFTGIGGDNVFCHTQSATPVVDRYRHEGLSDGTLQTISDVCTLTGGTVPQVMSRAIKRYFGPPFYRWAEDSTFLVTTGRPHTADRFPHPWLAYPKGTLPAKYAHIGMLARIQGTIDGYSRMSQPLQVNPLLSQPIIETCLRIPSWQWVAGGRDRAIARRAFATQLPASIINRRSKGGPESFACRVIDANRDQFKALLLDGLLAKNGLIDLRAIEACLMNPAPISTELQKRLGLLGEAEAWARIWNSPSGRRYPLAETIRASSASFPTVGTAQPFRDSDLPQTSTRI